MKLGISIEIQRHSIKRFGKSVHTRGIGNADVVLTKLAKTAEVLPNLRSSDPHLITERVGGDTNNAFIVQIIQIAVIAWKTPNDGIRNIFSFHNCWILLPDQYGSGDGNIIVDGYLFVNSTCE